MIGAFWKFMLRTYRTWQRIITITAWLCFISNHIYDHGNHHIHISRSQNEKFSINAVLVSACLSINSKKERRIQRKREEMEKNVGKCARLESKNTKNILEECSNWTCESLFSSYYTKLKCEVGFVDINIF